LARRGRNDGAAIVIKRIEEAAHGHHGGAWKVAYADFVTAMMAFFLLMWLLNATTEEQRRGLADYFNPTHVMASGASGIGQPFGGITPNAVGNMASDSGSVRVERGPRPILLDLEEEDDSDRPAEPFARRDAPAGDQDTPPQPVMAGMDGADQGPGGRPPGLGESHAARLTDQALQAEFARREQAAFEGTAELLREALRADPALAEVARQTLIEILPEGLRIQLLEADGQPMFLAGGAQPTERARAAIRAVAQAALRLGNPVAITGHTDATPFRNPLGAIPATAPRGNWELSAERANATRRLLQEAGLGDARIAGITGMADREPLLPAQPTAAGNRRVSVTLLRQAEPIRAPGARAP
jgi:chemotaxis protein MotB